MGPVTYITNLLDKRLKNKEDVDTLDTNVISGTLKLIVDYDRTNDCFYLVKVLENILM